MPLVLFVCGADCRYEFAPELNEVLHLHCRGLIKLSNLEVRYARSSARAFLCRFDAVWLSCLPLA